MTTENNTATKKFETRINGNPARPAIGEKVFDLLDLKSATPKSFVLAAEVHAVFADTLKRGLNPEDVITTHFEGLEIMKVSRGELVEFCAALLKLKPAADSLVEGFKNARENVTEVNAKPAAARKGGRELGDFAE